MTRPRVKVGRPRRLDAALLLASSARDATTMISRSVERAAAVSKVPL
jgi:hypothetical protein